MEKKKSSPKFRFAFLLIISSILLGYAISCKDKVKVQPIHTDAAQKDTGAFDGNFPFLAIPKTDLDDYFGTPPHQNLHKLVFRFRFANTGSLPGLAIYGATSMSTFQPPAAPIGVLSGTVTLNLPGELILGNLELSKTDYDSKWKGTAGTNPDLLLIPKMSPVYPHQVTYQMHWGKAITFTSDSLHQISVSGLTGGEDDLNPSPPAHPGN